MRCVCGGCTSEMLVCVPIKKYFNIPVPGNSRWSRRWSRPHSRRDPPPPQGELCTVLQHWHITAPYNGHTDIGKTVYQSLIMCRTYAHNTQPNNTTCSCIHTECL